MQVSRQKSTVKNKITYFLKNYVASLFTIFGKDFAIHTFFPTWYLDIRFWDLFSFICMMFIHSIGIFFFTGRKCVNLVVIFNKGREETSVVSLQNCKSCVCIKYFTLKRQLKLTAINYTWWKMHITSVSLKNIHFTTFWTDQTSRLFLLKKKSSPQKMFMSCFCLHHGACLNSTSFS